MNEAKLQKKGPGRRDASARATVVVGTLFEDRAGGKRELEERSEREREGYHFGGGGRITQVRQKGNVCVRACVHFSPHLSFSSSSSSVRTPVSHALATSARRQLLMDGPRALSLSSRLK